MKKNYLLLLSLLLSVGGISSLNLYAKEDSNVDVLTAKTIEEKMEIAKNELSLNIDINNVVADINLVYKGLYGTVITWSSSNENVVSINDETKRAYVTRPEANSSSVKVILTANLTLKESATSIIEDKKEFELTILPKNSSSSAGNVDSEIYPLIDNFNSYETNEDIGEYLAWNLTSGEGLTKVVTNVPNNNIIENQKVLRIDSKKQATEVKYVSNFYEDTPSVLEAYLMVVGEVNRVHLEVGRDDIFGPSIGIDHDNFYYYNNGDKVFNKDGITSPISNVWYKVRLEINPSQRTYKAGIYKLDGTDNVVLTSSIAYSGSSKYINQFRLRVEGGDKTGNVYLQDLKIDKKENLEANGQINPNRTDGIGIVDNFSESVLYINGDDKNYDHGFIIHNRFNNEKIYNVDTDYTLSKEVISSTALEEINKYTITLKSTGEIKELTQVVYKEEKDGIPSIENFKGSHLSRQVLNAETGQAASTGVISFKGLTRRSDSTIYYGLRKVTDSNSSPTVEDIKTGNNFYKFGSIKQESREIDVKIEGLSFSYEYDLFVVISNANGDSAIYSKENISEIINISTCEEFYDMTVNVNTYTNEFRLLNDLDFSNFEWKYDPTNTLKWKGKLDGQNYTISNLSIQYPTRKAAIFYEITDATIENLTIVNANISGLQDSAILVGYSNGGTINNVNFINPIVTYNNNDGSEGYFAIVAGRLHQGTTNMNNIYISGAKVTSNKYSGILTGNVNKDKDCVLNVKNCYVDASINCEGAAIGLVGRNRGTTNIENTICKLNIISAKKEMAVVAGHNKEGGILNVKKFIGYLTVLECAQPTYFNYFIGSQDDNTSKYSFEDVYFFEGNFEAVTDNFSPINTSRKAGKILSNIEDPTARWYEENTFIKAFETDKVWSYDETTHEIVYNYNKTITIKASDVNSLISLIKGDYSSNDHYYMKKALELYNALDDNAKKDVNKDALDNYVKAYNDFFNSVNSFRK